MITSQQRSADAKARLLAGPGDPLVHAAWRNVIFFHYRLDPGLMQQQLPPGFELDTYDGAAWITLVALTMRGFRPHHGSRLLAWGLPLLREQSFLNLRTYAKWRGERGAFFLWGWLSRPLNLPLPASLLGLSCSFAEVDYHCEQPAKTGCHGNVAAQETGFTFRTSAVDSPLATPCIPGSLSEFALESYSGFYWHHGSGRVFRAWHEPWTTLSLKAEIVSNDLILTRFPWFRETEFVSADFAPGFDEVWLGRPHRLDPAVGERHSAASTFFTMP